MRVRVDSDLCSGHARCWKLSGQFFKLDHDGYNAYRGTTTDVPAEWQDAVRKAVAKCPERAIKILDE